MSVLKDVIVVEQHAYAAALLSQFATIDENDEDVVIEVEQDLIDPTRIQKLIIANCRLKDEHMASLSTIGPKLSYLFYLNMSFNRLTSISFMPNLGGLSYLDISHNKIKSLAPLKGICHQLKVLRINNNDISQLDALSHMCNLVELWCCCNSIPWFEFYNLQSLVSLQQIVLYSNPALEKDEFYSFLCGCCPRLMRIDHHELFGNNTNGSVVAPRSPTKGIQKQKMYIQMNFQPGPDFLLTPSGRVMRTQARALLLNNGQTNVGGDIHSPPGESMSRRQSSHVNNMNNNSNSVAPTGGNVRTSVSGYGSTTRTNAPGGINKRPFTEGESLTGKVVTFKALKNVQNRIQELSSQVSAQGDDTEDDSGEEDIYTQNHYSPIMHKITGRHLGKTRSPAREGSSPYPSPRNILPTRDSDGGSMAGLGPIRQKLYFGGESDGDGHSNSAAVGAVACVVDESGAGYARWGKIETLACSFQYNKLFSSYRTGAVAVVLDVGTQSGSVMDSKGNTVLMFSVPQAGMGGVVNSGSGGGGGVTDAAPAPVARLMNPSNGVIKQVFTKGAATAVGKGKTKPKPISWTGDGLSITFDPVAWELSVLVDNGRCVSKFSSISGISIVKDLCTNNTSKQPTGRSKATKTNVNSGGRNSEPNSPRGQQPLVVGGKAKSTVNKNSSNGNSNKAGVSGGMFFAGGLSAGGAGGAGGGPGGGDSALASDQYAAALSPRNNDLYREMDYVNNDDYLPTNAHSQVKEGVSSVMSQLSDLDQMLSGMKLNSGVKGNSKRKS